MNNTPHNGGKAFPSDYLTPEYQGMSLRDWFAGQDAGLDEESSWQTAQRFTKREYPGDEADTRDIIKWWAEADANFRYMRADAMLAAREET